MDGWETTDEMGHWIWGTIKSATHILLLIHPFFKCTLGESVPCLLSFDFFVFFFFFYMETNTSKCADRLICFHLINEPPHLRGQSKPILREMLRRGRCSTSFSDWHIAVLHGQLDHFGFNCKILIVDLAHFQSKKLSWWLFMGFISNQLPWQTKDQNEEGAMSCRKYAWMLLEWFSSVSNDYRYTSSGAGVEEWWRGEGVLCLLRVTFLQTWFHKCPV